MRRGGGGNGIGRKAPFSKTYISSGCWIWQQQTLPMFQERWGPWKGIAGHLGVQYVRIEVGSVGPADYAEFFVNGDLLEYFGVGQRREDAPKRKDVSKIDLAFHSVVESNAEPVIRDAGHVSHIPQHTATPAERCPLVVPCGAPVPNCLTIPDDVR